MKPAADFNIAKPGQPPQVDQQARGRQAEGENRHQALSPGDDDRFRVRREKVNGLAKGAGGLVIEGRGFHCYTSREARPNGGQIARQRSRERRVRNPKRSHEHREPATALSSGQRQRTPHALTAA
jgi:hypothetical protein